MKNVEVFTMENTAFQPMTVICIALAMVSVVTVVVVLTVMKRNKNLIKRIF
ncbi:MAG: hypothetical protein HUJ51_04040 [Eggerthellaceae bacterium]|nr:hypothetical protein [Eggerthellaceae bacterium]